MNKRAIEKQIDVLVEKRSNLTTTLLVLIGGNVGLMFNLTNNARLALFAIGLILVPIFIIGLLSVEGKIITLLKELYKNEL